MLEIIKSTNMRSILTFVFSLLVMCSAMASSDMSSNVINGINVPPEPDPRINNATLAGVDSNNNGIRDDVERVLAREFGSDSVKYAEAKKFALAEQQLVANPSKSSISAYISLIPCTPLSAEESDKLTYSILNTGQRSGVYGNALAGASWGGCKNE